MASRYLREVEWQILHAINLYVFRNGRDGEQPVLVHIPPEKKKNMKSVMKTIQDRIKFPIGYATQLYNMEGRKVRQISELQQYHCYVAASNYDKHFSCTQYGRKRSPLLVLSRDSKHVRFNIRTDNYERMLKKKFIGEEMPDCISNSSKLKPNGNANDTLRRPTTYQTYPQSQSHHHVPTEFTVSTGPMTEMHRPNETRDIEPQVRQQSPIDEEEELVEDEWTSEEEPSSITISSRSINNRELERDSANSFFDRPETGSQERLNRRYLEIFKQAKSGGWKNQEAGTSEYSILTHASDHGTRVTIGSYNNRPNGANGYRMLVLPPPPREFQDERFLPEIPVFKNVSLQNPSETFCSFKNSREIKRLADPPFVLMEGHLRPQLRKYNAQQEMTTSSRSRKNISKRICRILQSSGGLCSPLSFGPDHGYKGGEAIRPNSFRDVNTAGDIPRGRLSTPFSASHNVSAQTFKNGQFMQGHSRLNSEPPQDHQVKLRRVSTPFRTNQNSSSQALNDGQSKQKCSRPSFQLQELDKPSYETIVIHNRTRTMPQRSKDVVNFPLPSRNSQRTSYRDATTNPSRSSDKNFKEMLHKNPSSRPKPTKAKLIIRNGYSSS